MLSIPIDADRLYENSDPAYLIWVRSVIAECIRLRTEINNARG